MSTVNDRSIYDGPVVELLGYQQAADILGCSVTQVRLLIDRGSLTVYPHSNCSQGLVTGDSVRAYQHAKVVAELSEGV